MQTKPPVIKQLPERRVACVSHTGNYVGDSELFMRLFTRLGAWANDRDVITSETVFLAAYENYPGTTAPDDLRLDVCLSIPESTVVDADIQHKLLPGGSYGVMRAEVAYPKEYETAWNEVTEWAENNGYQVDMSRPSYEIYLNNPEEHPQRHQIVDICLSVASR